MTTAIQNFLETAPEGAAHVLQLLAIAESLTDNVARDIYVLEPIDGLSPDAFVKALHYADFVAARNSEWHFLPEARRELQALRGSSPDVVNAAHRALLALGAESDHALAGSVIPAYLFTDAGRAYHSAAIGEREEALALYGKAAKGPLTGAQWLASKLAIEQEDRGILPAGRIETMFLRAMVWVREGDRRKAEPLLRRIASSDEIRIEVAISCHVLAGIISRTERTTAEQLFRKSILQKERLHDLAGQAHSLHSLANLIGRDRNRRSEAEELYRRSIEIGNEIENRYHVAQTLHSLANLIGRDPNRHGEAEELYRYSVKIREEIGDRHGIAQTMHSLANLIGRDRNRHGEAEGLYRRSVKILEEIGDRYGIAQTMHSLANLIGRDRNRQNEAEELYRRSIEMDESLGNQYGVAQTMHSLANLIGRDRNRRGEAEELLRESLRIGDELRNWRHQAQVLRSLSFVVEHRSPREAEQLLEQSLELNRRERDRSGENLVRRSLQQLRERYRL